MTASEDNFGRLVRYNFSRSKIDFLSLTAGRDIIIWVYFRKTKIIHAKSIGKCLLDLLFYFEEGCQG